MSILSGSSILIGVRKFVFLLDVLIGPPILQCPSDDDEDDMDTVFCLIVVNAVEWNGLFDPWFTKCTAPCDNVVVLRLQMPTSSSVLLSLTSEDDEEHFEEEEEDNDSISTSSCAAIILETFPQTMIPFLSLFLFPYGE